LWERKRAWRSACRTQMRFRAVSPRYAVDWLTYAIVREDRERDSNSLFSNHCALSSPSQRLWRKELGGRKQAAFASVARGTLCPRGGVRICCMQRGRSVRAKSYCQQSPRSCLRYRVPALADSPNESTFSIATGVIIIHQADVVPASPSTRAAGKLPHARHAVVRKYNW